MSSSVKQDGWSPCSGRHKFKGPCKLPNTKQSASIATSKPQNYHHLQNACVQQANGAERGPGLSLFPYSPGSRVPELAIIWGFWKEQRAAGQMRESWRQERDVEVVQAGPCLRAQDNTEGDGQDIFQEKEKAKACPRTQALNRQIYPVRNSGLRPRGQRLQGLARRQIL